MKIKFVSGLSFFVFSIFSSFFFTSKISAQDQVYIKVGDAKVKRSLMAIPPFQQYGSGGLQSKNVGVDLFNTFLNDMDVSGYFEFVKSDAFLEDTSKVGLKPIPTDSNGFNFENWKKIGAEFLVRAGFKVADGKVTLEAYVYSVSQSKLIRGREYTGKIEEVREVAHSFANDLIEGITGKKGFFLTKIVAASDRAGNNWKEIYVMDWDAASPKKITDHKSIAISPTWAPDGKSVLYTAYVYHKNAKTNNASLFSYELFTGKRFIMSSRPGINSGAAFTPDGKYVFLTISQGGNPDIFRVNSEGEGQLQITKGPAGSMNVEPAISPDGKKIAFSSNRSGFPMIYVMNIDGTNVERQTFAGRYNATPSWSPDSKILAFAGYDKTHFDIFTLNYQTKALERLTSANKTNGKPANNEEPTFSPDGRHIIFTSDRSGTKQLYIINVDGSNERRLTVDKFNYFKPKWLWKQD